MAELIQNTHLISQVSSCVPSVVHPRTVFIHLSCSALRGARTNYIRLHLVVSAFEDVGCVRAACSLPVLLRADACSTTARSKPRAGRATKVAWSLRVPSGNNSGSTAEGNGNTTGAGHFSLEVPQSPRAGPHAANTRSRMANREQPLARRCFALPGNDATGLEDI